MKVIFTFALDTDTGDAVWAGNISAQEALQLLQQIIIVDAIQTATQSNGDKEEKEGRVEKDAPAKI